MSNQESTEPLDQTGMLEILNKEDDAVDLLKSDEKSDEIADKKADKEELVAKEESDEESDKTDDEEELEIEEPTEIDELITPVRKKEILAAYPDLFKKFPYLEKAYYREQQYAEVFPTVEDAKEAVERAQTLQRFEQELFKGSTESVLQAVKDTDQKAYGRIVDNYLPALLKVDQGAYYHVVGNVIRQAANGMLQEAATIGNENSKEALQNAALVLNQFIFGNSQVNAPSRFSKEAESPESDSLKKEREQFARERLDNAVESISTRVENALKSTISINMDPKNHMTDYVKKTATNEALGLVKSLIDKDTRFRAHYDGLWRKAAETNYNRQAMDNIRSAYLNKAKSLLRDVIQRTRNEALRGLSVTKRKDSDEQRDKKGPVPPGRSSSGQSGSKDKAAVPKGMSYQDFLAQD